MCNVTRDSFTPIAPLMFQLNLYCTVLDGLRGVLMPYRCPNVLVQEVTNIAGQVGLH